MTRRDLARLGVAGVASLHAALVPFVRTRASEAHASPLEGGKLAAATSEPTKAGRAQTLAQDRTVSGLYGANGVSGVALSGFDPVSYFLPGAEPEGGRSGIEWRYAGVDWRFANRGNREAFRRDTAVYLPRCGGFDPVSVVAGRLVAADPLVYALVAGRLYLFRDAGRRGMANANLLAEAERRYPALLAAPE